MTLKISVVTAVYNRVDTVAEALQSVRSQTWPSVEHIVIDGGSTDGTLSVLQAHSRSLDVLVSEPDKGLYDALNKGIGRASGDVVGFLHADDRFEAVDSLARVAAAFDDPDVGAVYGDLVYVQEKDPAQVVRYWRAGSFDPGSLGRGWMPPHPTLYVRRAIYERIGGFDTRFHISADYESILRMFGHGGVTPAYVPHVLVRMRLGGMSNRSLTGLLRKSFEDYLAMQNNKIGGVWTLARKNIVKLPQFLVREPGRDSAA